MAPKLKIGLNSIGRRAWYPVLHGFIPKGSKRLIQRSLIGFERVVPDVGRVLRVPDFNQPAAVEILVDVDANRHVVPVLTRQLNGASGRTGDRAETSLRGWWQAVRRVVYQLVVCGRHV